MYSFFICLVLLNFASCLASNIDIDELRCLVCKTTLDELSKAVKKIDPEKTVQIGNGRLDADGNYKQKTVPQSKSELHLSELIDDVCGKMEDYVRATWKSTGKLTLLRLVSDNGQMNPAMSDVDIIQDDDLNKSVKYNCEAFVEEHEEDIIKQYIDNPKNAQVICSTKNICPATVELHNEL